ncbi:MAG: outer membrane protein assembly factor BamD [Gammaproteobacteria bacterium]
MKTLVYLFMSTFLMLALSGCGKSKEEIYAAMTDEEIYTEAATALENGKYAKAIEGYQQLDAQYPFGEYTEQGQLEIIYAYYREDELPASLGAADRFIRLHPRNPHVDYAYYMRGIVKFTENNSLVDRFLPIERGLRDLSSPRDAYNYFAELVRLYPNSPYSVDARQRMLFIRNVLANNELAAAEWYIKRKAYLAAANRAQYVVEHFPEAPAVPKALAVMAYAYEQLGLDDLAVSSNELLEENYPDSQAAKQVEHDE